MSAVPNPSRDTVLPEHAGNRLGLEFRDILEALGPTASFLAFIQSEEM
jgi:hypothetical protein